MHKSGKTDTTNTAYTTRLTGMDSTCNRFQWSENRLTLASIQHFAKKGGEIMDLHIRWIRVKHR